MKKAVIECDYCHKHFNEETSFYATVFINENGIPTRQIDVCEECLETAGFFDTPILKGGGEE